MQAILLNIPTSFETSRLQLRKPFPGDGEELYPFLSIQNPLITPEDAEYIIRESHINFISRKSMTFHIYLREQVLFIGMITILPVNWDIPYVQISFLFDEKYQHNYYEIESLKASIYYAKHILQANRIEIQCIEEDNFNKNIIEEIGFQLEGKLKNYYYNSNTNEISNICIYSIWTTILHIIYFLIDSIG